MPRNTITEPALESPLDFDLRDRLAKSLRVSEMSPGQMAEALGVHRNTVSAYLYGRSPLDRRTLIAWAMVSAPEVTVEWLETGRMPSDDGPVRHPGLEPGTHWLRDNVVHLGAWQANHMETAA